LLMRKHLKTLAIVVLALASGSGVGRAQNNERLDQARQTQANNLQDEIAKVLRLYYDAWTKLDATEINNNLSDDGFVKNQGRMISAAVLKARIRQDFASTPASANYHFEVQDLKVFQPDNGTAIANYRLTSTPSNKRLDTTVENITDIFVRRDGRWL